MTTISPEALAAAKERLRKALNEAATAVRFFARWEAELDLEVSGLLEQQYGTDGRALSRRGSRQMRMMVAQKGNGTCVANSAAVAIAREVLDIIDPGTVEKCLETKARREKATRKHDAERTVYDLIKGQVEEHGPQSAVELLNYVAESLHWLPELEGRRMVLVAENVVPLDRRRA